MGELLPVGPYLDLRMLSADHLGLGGYDPAMLGQRFNLRNLAFAGLHTETVKHAWGQFMNAKPGIVGDSVIPCCMEELLLGLQA